MKNQYAAKCYICGQQVGPRDGLFEHHGSKGRVRHVDCNVKK